MQQPLVLDSSGKVNIGLQVLDQRPDGYHNIHTVFQELKFPDKVILTPRSEGWKITSNNDQIPCDDSNICIQAFLALQDRFPDIGGIEIHLEKTIPPGSGLGGGSSNAAKTLIGLNEIYSLGLSTKMLEKIGSKLGADVPFFINGGTQVGDGIGNLLTPLNTPVTGAYLLAMPSISINTAFAYGALKNSLEKNRKPRNFARLLSENNISLSVFENDFERIVIPTHPKIGQLKLALLEYGAKFSSLSGSGSTVYGIFDDEALAIEAESKINPIYKTVITVPTNN